jgi:hypothetical protein
MTGDELLRHEVVRSTWEWQQDRDSVGPYGVTRGRLGVPKASGVAQGDILPSRFVALAGRGKVKQAAVGDVLCGISAEEPRGSPVRQWLGQADTRAAADGEDCFVFGGGASEVPLLLGGPVYIGQRLTADSQGRGVVTGPGWWALAIAEEDGSEGDVRLVNLLPYAQLTKGTLSAAARVGGSSTVTWTNTRATWTGDSLLWFPH